MDRGSDKNKNDDIKSHRKKNFDNSSKINPISIMVMNDGQQIRYTVSSKKELMLFWLVSMSSIKF